MGDPSSLLGLLDFLLPGLLGRLRPGLARVSWASWHSSGLLGPLGAPGAAQLARRVSWGDPGSLLGRLGLLGLSQKALEARRASASWASPGRLAQIHTHTHTHTHTYTHTHTHTQESVRRPHAEALRNAAKTASFLQSPLVGRLLLLVLRRVVRRRSALLSRWEGRLQAVYRGRWRKDGRIGAGRHPPGGCFGARLTPKSD